jgi:hypothetical protein
MCASERSATWGTVETGAVHRDTELCSLIYGCSLELVVLLLVIACADGGRWRRGGRRGREAGEEGGRYVRRNVPSRGWSGAHSAAGEARGQAAEQSGGRAPEHLDGETEPGETEELNVGGLGRRGSRMKMCGFSVKPNGPGMWCGPYELVHSPTHKTKGIIHLELGGNLKNHSLRLEKVSGD